MRKIIYISVLLMGFLSAAEAQKKFVYEDTSLLQKEEQYVIPDDEQVEIVTEESSSDEVTPYEEEPADTSLYLNELRLPYDSIKNWKNLKDYAYTKYLDSLLKNQKVEEKKTETRPSSPGLLSRILNSSFSSVLLWALAIFFVLFLIYRLFLAEGVFKRKSASLNNTETVAEEQITGETDFDSLIRTALQNNNYRHAVRYQYLRSLHYLAGKNLVELAPDKTNFQYVREIKNRDMQNEFASLTLNYEYVWYGEFSIESEVYQKIEKGFTGFNQKL